MGNQDHQNDERKMRHRTIHISTDEGICQLLRHIWCVDKGRNRGQDHRIEDSDPHDLVSYPAAIGDEAWVTRIARQVGVTARMHSS